LPASGAQFSPALGRQPGAQLLPDVPGDRRPAALGPEQEHHRVITVLGDLEPLATTERLDASARRDCSGDRRLYGHAAAQSRAGFRSGRSAASAFIVWVAQRKGVDRELSDTDRERTFVHRSRQAGEHTIRAALVRDGAKVLSVPNFRQMSMPKPVCPNVATTTPLGPPGAQTAEKQHAGLLKMDAQPSAARIRLHEGAVPKVAASVRRACIPGIYVASDPNRDLEGS
jgi:hypothetical protein